MTVPINVDTIEFLSLNLYLPTFPLIVILSKTTTNYLFTSVDISGIEYSVIIASQCCAIFTSLLYFILFYYGV